MDSFDVVVDFGVVYMDLVSFFCLDFVDYFYGRFLERWILPKMIQAKVSNTEIRLIPSNRNELNLLKRCTRIWILTKIPVIKVDMETPALRVIKNALEKAKKEDGAKK